MTRTFRRRLPAIAAGLAALVVVAMGMGVAPAAAEPTPAASQPRSAVVVNQTESGDITVDMSQWVTSTTARPTAKIVLPGAVLTGGGEVVFCSDPAQKHCLKPFTGEVKHIFPRCNPEWGGDGVDVVVFNSNPTRALVDLTVYVDHVEQFGLRGWARPGKTIIAFRGVEDGEYAMNVGWDGSGEYVQGPTFYGRKLRVNCGPMPHPTPTPSPTA